MRSPAATEAAWTLARRHGPVPQTNSDILARRYPGYGVVWLEERDGVRVIESVPGMVFRADVKAAQEKERAFRESRLREIRKAEIERQQALENAGPRRAFKAGKAMIEKLLTPSDSPPPVVDPETAPYQY